MSIFDSIGGLFGMGGGQSGTGVPAPQLAQITNPVTQQQMAQAQGGVQNSLGSQQALLQALQQQQGLNNQTNVYNQMQGVANGTGPNPAQNMLNQQTGQNVANQAAMMAGQRGTGANAGMMARQIGQQGGAIQQNAVGQGATMQANQQLGALGAMGNMANQQAANQIGATQANAQLNLANQQNQLGAMGQYNNAAVSNQGNVNTVQGQLANTQLGAQDKAIAGLMSGAGAALGTMIMPGAGTVGGSKIGSALGGALGGKAMASGGEVHPDHQSSCVHYMEKMFTGGGVGSKLKSGGHVPGKASVAGDSLKNDNVSALLSPGEIVIPRSAARSKESAAKFVEAVLAKKKGKK